MLMSSEHKLTNKELRKIFWRSCQLDASWNYERQQNLGYSYAMLPAVKKIYSGDSKKAKSALKRGLDFMAITPQISTLLMGINAAMDERNAENDEFDESSIAAVKTSLMGPLAGIGDSLIAGTLRIIATGIAIGFAQQGNLLGPLLFLLIYNVPGFIIRFYGLKYGYHYGAYFITNAEKTGLMDKITYAASIVGLTAIGGMISQYIVFDVSGVKIGTGKFAQPLNTYLDMIMPKLIPLLIFLLIYWIVGKKVKTSALLIWTVVVCIGGAFIISLI
ncbi:PTS system mannose/fructose/sorbose family transporter subunit IID [Pediococcus acidilactici]|uniref:PTS system mannose/fructose/sorbose family transporter subunit IID n=2 Tax=Pediococcus acidilactici TaxID=1254 RepID=UPI000B3534CB|nr:PTS mannose transporter subunit IID [Pediococcus acidilactici]KAF0351429.1 PTS mannose transporter subunit IID [Pediococcus acidilactici]KAF0355171.1 PTS mannose transporter subunit IID [Pediococcus acidilactici]KAF0358848.1 PTS mannose transporter subunit IID [Pediococcus acidilactici]KAF0373819.1 PTS mannose transporter subunit IID [Pediococcus acidilactici]